MLNVCKYSLGHEDSIQSRDKDTRIRVKNIYELKLKVCEYRQGHTDAVRQSD